PDGWGNPQAPLIEGSDGALYGTTFWNAGSVFRLDKDGSHFMVLRAFSYPDNDAMRPLGAVVEGPDGVLYGTAHQGSSSGAGAVFKLNKDGSDYLMLYGFTGTNGGGANPDGALLLGSDGAFYTTTSAGGDTGDGSIYKIRTLP